MSPTRTGKRRRVSSAQEEKCASPDKHTIFTKWAEEKGVQTHNVTPAALPGRGMGLVTTAKIKKDARILFVPEKAMFKPNAMIFGKQQAKWFQRTASPHVQLALSIMSECQNADSPLHIWKATWPPPQTVFSSIPLFWEAHLQDMLPPSVEHPFTRLKEDWAKDQAFFFSVESKHQWKYEDLKYYWAIVNSRSFHFQHRGRPGFMVLCPFIDYINHGPSGTGVNIRRTPEGYEVTADREYESGEELLATYGAHPNDKLLVHYGFVNSNKPGQPSDDDLRLDHCILPHLSEKTRGQLQDFGFLGGYALLPATNELCFKTQVAVRAELLKPHEWKYFLMNGEDMGLDQSDKIQNWLKVYLIEYCMDAQDKIKGLDKMKPAAGPAEAVAVSLLRERWEQIIDALDTFLV